MAPTFSIVNLPKLPPQEYSPDNENARNLAHKFQQLRLSALKQDPEAFGSSYENEIQRDLTFTLERLANPKADHFIAVDCNIEPWTVGTGESFFRRLFDARWVGMFVKIGPLEAPVSARQDPLAKRNAELKTSDGPVSSTVRSQYHFNGTFVEPGHRGSGIGLAMMDAAFKKALAAAGDGEITHFAILVDSENGVARGLYRRAGFEEVMEEMYTQQPRQQLGELRSVERTAIRMELSKTKSDAAA